jgi:hypothetical protein
MGNIQRFVSKNIMDIVKKLNSTTFINVDTQKCKKKNHLPLV